MNAPRTDRQSPPRSPDEEPSTCGQLPFSLPPDLDEIKVMARSLARTGRIDQAILCWQRVEELDPYDAEPSRMLASLTLKKTRQVDPAEENGRDVAESSRRVSAQDPSNMGETPGAAKPNEALPALPASAAPAPRQLVLTPRQQLELEIAQRPEDETNYLALAELHLAERRTYDAQRTLIRAREISRSPTIVERLEDVNMLLAKEKVKLAEERAAAERTSESQELVKTLREESFQLELDVFRNRCFRHPEDKRLKFQLGMRLKQIGSHREALEFLQAGLEFPELRAAASLEIGEVLQRHSQFPKALQCYRQAAQLAAGDENLADCRKRALYRAGVLATAMTLTDTARGYLAELVKMAPGYRDAQTRLDKLAEISDTF